MPVSHDNQRSYGVSGRDQILVFPQDLRWLGISHFALYNRTVGQGIDRAHGMTRLLDPVLTRKSYLKNII